MTREEEIDQAWFHHTKPAAFEAARRAKWLAIRHEEQNGLCKYCEIETVIQLPLSNPVPLDIRATVDHVIARSVGGTDTFENIVCACAPCNTLKGNGTVEMLFSDPRFRERVLGLEAERASSRG